MATKSSLRMKATKARKSDNTRKRYRLTRAQKMKHLRIANEALCQAWQMIQQRPKEED